MKKEFSNIYKCNVCQKNFILHDGYLVCPSGHRQKDFVLPELRVWEELEWVKYLSQFDKSVNHNFFYKYDINGSLQDKGYLRYIYEGKIYSEKYKVFESWFQPSDGNCFYGSWFENFVHVIFTTWYNVPNEDLYKYRICVSGTDDHIMSYFSNNFEEIIELKEIIKIAHLSPYECKKLGFIYE